MDELEEMRQQMALLQNKLDQEIIISDRLLRTVTRQKVHHLNRHVWLEGLAALFVITFGNYTFLQTGCSPWFLAGTSLLMIACFLATIIPHSRIRKRDVMSGDLLQVAKQVRRLRQWYKTWIRIGMPLAIVWFVWFISELYFHVGVGDKSLFLAMSVGALVGGLIGGLIGLRRHHNLVREMDDIIHEIES